ncbi:host RNA manipulator TomO [Wolbachia endosymbiont (group A) of Melieria omissa]|uniref:host RNA manipulator TomO n=1 Tax=Wolbachia endosymbiont (group A) of Melieria omissa TaxID=3139311 RepID=UPI003CCB4B32
MFGSNFRDFVSQDTTSQGQSNSERLIKSWHGFEKPDSEDSGIEEEFEVLDSESQEIPATPCSTPPEDLSLENAILANFPDGCDRSFTVELKDEDSYGIIPKNLTFAEIINILNQAIQEDNCEELDKVVQNIEDYEGRSITLDNENLKDFCSNQLNLELQNGSNHQHIYSNVLSQYKFDQEGFKYDYSVKELVLLAIAANDKLVEQYQDFLFAEGNLSLLPLLVGGQKYIEAFIEKFHGTDGVYGRLKDQTIQLVEPNKIGFFSVIALRKEQELLNAVFVEYVLRDFGQVLKTSNPDSLYGVLETASLIKNEEFITIVLGAFERYINKLTKKASTEELLKKSFVTLLETAISQEHTSVIEYLCKRYTNSADHAIYDVYEQAFADDKVITILGQQILKNIGARGRKEIYDLILKTALDAGNIAFIEHLCEKCAKCSNDVIGYLNQKFKNNEFDNIHESILIALSNVEYTNTDVIVEVLFYTKEIHQNVSHNEQVIRPVIQNILKNATHYSIGQEDYSLVKEVCYLYTEEGAINVIFQEECKIFKSSIEKRIEDLEKENKLLQSEALREYNSRLPGIVNGLVQTACIVYDEYTKDPKDNKRQKNIDLIFSLMQIRNILQFSIDVQKYSCHERQDLWDEMCQTPGTFIIRKRSNNVADELEIPVITSDILSENPGLESTGSQQPQENVDRRENIMNNEEASIEEAIDNDYRGGKMPRDKKSTKQKMSRNKNSTEQKLLNAIYIPKTMESYLKRNNIKDEPILKSIIDKVNAEIQKKKEEEKNIINPGPTKKQRCIDQRNTLLKTRDFLEKKIKSIGTDAKAAVSSVTDVSATTSSHEAPVNIDDEKKQAHAQPAEHVPEESAKLKAQPSNTQEQQEVSETPVPEQTDDIESLSTQDALVPQSKSATVLSVDSDEEKQASLSDEVFYDAEESMLGTTNSKDGSTLEGDSDKQEPQPKSVPTPLVAKENSGQVNNVQSNGRQSDNQNNKDIQDVSATISDQVTPVSSDTENNKVEKSGVSLQSSGYVDNSTVLSFVDRERVIHVDAQVSGDVSCLVETISEDTDEVASNQNGVLLLEAQPMVQSYDSSEKGNTNLQSAGDSSVGVVSKNGSDQLPADNLEQNSKGVDDSSVSVQSIGMVISQSNSASTITLDDHKPLMKDIENDNDPSEEDNDSPQNIKKSTLSTIVVSTLVVAAVASIAISVYLEMLAVGIAVGACCLIVAIVTYCYRPKTLIENDKVERVNDDMQKITPCCS